METMTPSPEMQPMTPAQPLPAAKKNKFLPMLLVIVLIVAVLGGGLFLWQQSNNSDEDSNQDQSNNNDALNDEESYDPNDDTEDTEDEDEDEDAEEVTNADTVFEFGDYKLTFETTAMVQEVVSTDSYIENLPYETCVLRPDNVEPTDDKCTYTTYSFGTQSRNDFMVADTDRFYFGPGGTVPTRLEKTDINDLQFNITYFDDIAYDNQIMMVSSCPFEDLCIFFAPEVQYLDMNSEEEYILTDVEVEDFLDLMETLTIEEK